MSMLRTKAMSWPIAFASVSLGSLAAQAKVEPPRDRLLGRVVTNKGARWAEARVHLFSRAVPSRLDVGKPDHIRVQTDARGRFEAQLLRGRSYSAWAEGTKDSDRYTTTNIAEHVRAGAPLRLTGDAYSRIPTRIRLRVIGEKAPLSLLLMSETRNRYAVPVEIDDANEAILPVLPGDNAWLEVRAGRRLVALRKIRVTAMRIERSIPDGDFLTRLGAALNRQEATEAARSRRVRTIAMRVPRPRSVRVQARDLAGKPLAGATIRGLASYRPADHPWSSDMPERRIWVELGKTGAAGDCEVLVPDSILLEQLFTWREPLFTSSLDGHTTTFTKVADLKRAPAVVKLGRSLFGPKPSKESKEKNITIQFSHDRARALRGRVRIDGDAASAGLRITARSPTVDNDQNRLWRTPIYERDVQTDADGAFALEDLRARSPLILVSALPHDVRRRLGFPVVEQPVLLHATDSHESDDPIEIRLDRLRPIRLHLSRSDRSPARLARVHLLPVQDAGAWSGSDVGPQLCLAGYTDRLGRATFLAPPGRYAILASHDDEAVTTSVDTTDDGDAKPIAMRPLAFASGRVLGRNGRPIAGAEVSLSGWTGAPWLVRQFARGSESTKTDANGRFTLRFVAVPGAKRQLTVWTEGGEEPVQETASVPGTGSKSLEIALDIEAPPPKGRRDR